MVRSMLVHDECADKPGRTWPPSLGLFKSIIVTLTYLRRNRVQAELAETFGVSHPTISRAVINGAPVNKPPPVDPTTGLLAQVELINSSFESADLAEPLIPFVGDFWRAKGQ